MVDTFLRGGWLVQESLPTQWHILVAGVSLGYLTWDGRDARDLYGCGQYAYDSWRIFVRGDRPDTVSDGPLRLYLARWHSGWREGDKIPERFRMAEESSLNDWDKKSL